jgi:hypothetical protein
LPESGRSWMAGQGQQRPNASMTLGVGWHPEPKPAEYAALSNHPQAAPLPSISHQQPEELMK